MSAFFVSDYRILDRIRSNEQVFLVDEDTHCFHNKGSLLNHSYKDAFSDD